MAERHNENQAVKVSLYEDCIFAKNRDKPMLTFSYFYMAANLIDCI